MGRRLAHWICAAAVATMAPSAMAGKCQDIPLRATLYDNAFIDPDAGLVTASAIRSDGKGEYLNGVSASASIKVCSGTHDAVVNLTGYKRTFTFEFPRPLEGSVVDAVPGWVPGSHAVSGWINVRNLTFSLEPFATHAGSNFTVTGDRATYRLGFKGYSPHLETAPNLHDPGLVQADNTPLPSSPVIVYPNYPQSCSATNMPTWLVRATSMNATVNNPGTALQVGTLYKQASNPQGTARHQGQYTLPFEMRLEALKCFVY